MKAQHMDRLFEAIALFLIFEGIFPFITPNKWRYALKQLIQLPDHVLRLMGLSLLLMGCALLSLI